MPLAEVIVRRGDRGAAPLPFNDVSSRFEVAITERGPVGRPIDTRTWSQVQAAVGGHTAYSTLHATDSYYAEGGTRTVLSRVVGPAAAPATLALRDRDGNTVLTVTAEGPGSWYHGIRVIVATGSATDERVITVALNGAPVVSGTVATADAAKQLIDSSGLVSAALGRSSAPIAAPFDQALAGGTDDRANITDRQVGEALAVFTEDLGPGSVTASSWSSVTVHRALAQHAATHNRFARADLPSDGTATSLIAHAGQIRSLPEARYIQLLAGWPQVTVGGVTVAVPPSGVHTGREARTDVEASAGPAQPAAWTFGAYTTPLDVLPAFSRSDREAMTDAGITLLVRNEGQFFAEDAVTAADRVRFPQFAEVAGMRVTMAIHHRAKAVLRRRVRQLIDGRGHLVSAVEKDLIGICSEWYLRDALYGETADEAYSVTVTPELPAGQPARLVANLVLRPSPSVQTIELTIVQVAAGDTI